MKCQNCGKNEINFHYSSNINGSITETNLCSVCAAEKGYLANEALSLFDSDSFFADWFPVFGKLEALLPVSIPVITTGTGFPFSIRPRLKNAQSVNLDNRNMRDRQDACDRQDTRETCHTCETCHPGSETKVDAEMSKRREINMLKEQMRVAAEKDEFEKAIEIRDKIKHMEAQV